MYVVDISAEDNIITIGNQDALLCHEFIVDEINLISMTEITQPLKAEIKIRYNDEGHKGTLLPYEKRKLRVVFDDPQKSVTPGQSAVFFSDDLVIGGGIIEHRM